MKREIVAHRILHKNENILSYLRINDDNSEKIKNKLNKIISNGQAAHVVKCIMLKHLKNAFKKVEYVKIRNVLSNVFDWQSEAFLLYSNIVLSNLTTQKETDDSESNVTEVHHIIPYTMHSSLNLHAKQLFGIIESKKTDIEDIEPDIPKNNIINKDSNLVRLPLFQHALAHFYLFQSLNFEEMEKMSKSKSKDISRFANRTFLALLRGCYSFSHQINELAATVTEESESIDYFGLHSFEMPEYWLEKIKYERDSDECSFVAFSNALAKEMTYFDKRVTNDRGEETNIEDFINKVANEYKRANPASTEHDIVLFKLSLKAKIISSENDLQYPFPENDKCAKFNVSTIKETYYIKSFIIPKMFKVIHMETGETIKDILGNDLLFLEYKDIEKLLPGINKNSRLENHCNEQRLIKRQKQSSNLTIDGTSHYIVQKTEGTSYNNLIINRNKVHSDVYYNIRNFYHSLDSGLTESQKLFLYLCKKQEMIEIYLRTHDVTEAKSMAPCYFMDLKASWPLREGRDTKCSYIQNVYTKEPFAIYDKEDFELLTAIGGNKDLSTGHFFSIQNIEVTPQNGIERIDKPTICLSVSSSAYEKNSLRDYIQSDRNKYGPFSYSEETIQGNRYYKLNSNCPEEILEWSKKNLRKPRRIISQDIS